ncbi:MAG TPA: SNF2-related protein, partial [Anaerolineales bacterium]|nr:SNF2-related protein [Anaerolineales bacterium]
MSKLSSEVLNLAALRDAVPRQVMESGEAFLREGRVEIDELTDHIALVKVHDYREFSVKISLSSNYLYLRCECPAAENGSICKHDVAAFMAVRKRLTKDQTTTWEEQLNNLLAPVEYAPASTARNRTGQRAYLLFFCLLSPTHSSQDFYTTTYGYGFWRIAPYRLPLSALPAQLRTDEYLHNPARLAQAVEETAGLSHQARAALNHLDPDVCVNADFEAVSLANLLIDRNRAYTFSGARFPLADYLALVAETGSPLFLGSANEPLDAVLHIHPEPASAQLTANRAEDGIHIRPQLSFAPEANVEPILLAHGDIHQINDDPLWLLVGRDLFRLAGDTQGKADLWLLKAPEIHIPIDQEAHFLQEFYPALAEKLPLEGELIQRIRLEAEPVGRIYLTEVNGKLQAELRFAYGDYETVYESNSMATIVTPKPGSWELVEIKRRLDIEERLYSAVSSSAYRLKRAPRPAAPGKFVLRANAHPIDFLMYSVPRLAQDGYQIFGEENLKSIRVSRARPTISFNVSSGIDWFDVNAVVKFDDLEVSLMDLRRAFRKQQRFIKLADGSVGELPPEWMEQYKHLFALGEQQGEALRLADHHLTVIDQLLADAPRAQTDPEYERRRQRLRDFDGIQAVPVPAGFSGELRSYQKAGYDWLHFLREYKYGGCLADDMGLGKTVQALAFLQSLREMDERDAQNGAPREPLAASLLVAPRSLLVNWQREAARFTPQLRVLVYAAGDRPKDTRAFDEVDLVITTYGIMRRDIQRLTRYTFNYALLDESQAIKNPFSQTSKAARLLRSRRRLALTGTPVENSTVELWSQFAFLNPGLLGNFDYFKTEFAGPIERAETDPAAAEKSVDFLRKLVYPFILRRTKDQVAPELPPRTERILYADMAPGQRKLYNRTRDLYRGLLLGMLESEGMQNSR